MKYELPTSVEINGSEYEVRTDYRAILDILEAINDPELTEEEKAIVMLDIFYPTFSDIPLNDIQDAIDRCIWFIDCGEKQNPSQKLPRLMSWDQDFPYIISPINRVVGRDIRSISYDFKEKVGGLHWWTFISSYMEIGDCLFAQIVGIRSKLAKGEKLDKAEQKWYRENRNLVDIKTKYSEAENELLKAWGV